MQFVLFNDSVREEIKSRLMPSNTTKAVSIQAISKEKFVILDSNGDLHILQVSKSGSSQMRQLTCTIQARQLATSPDAFAGVLLPYSFLCSYFGICRIVLLHSEEMFVKQI